MLCMINKKLVEIKENNVMVVVDKLDDLNLRLESLCKEPEKPKRTRTVKKDTVVGDKKPATQRKANTQRKRQVKPKEKPVEVTEAGNNEGDVEVK